MSSSHVNGRAAGDGAVAAAEDEEQTTPQPPVHSIQPIPSEENTAGRNIVALFDAEDVVESPVDEDSGVGSGFFRPTGSTWPALSAAVTAVTRRGVSASEALGGNRLRMSVNPRYSVTENLRSGNSSRTSLVSVEGVTATRQAQRVRRSRAASLEVQDTPLPNEAEEEDEVISMEEQDGGPVMEAALPENDGMQSLRSKLLEIKQLALSTEEKAKRMHDLMTRDYLAHRASLAPSTPPMQASPSQRPLEQLGPSVLAPPIDPTNPYSLQPSDLEPSVSPVHDAHAHSHGEGESMEEDDAPVLGCKHYKRNVKVQCFDCHRWFPCRHCHDVAKDLAFPHALNRKKTQNMLCMLCKTPQPAGETCVNCGEYAAWYYCSKCKLWDNDSNKRIYHCDDCGLCRLGEGLGKDFVHCRRCNVCISIQTSSSHPCIERATDSDCPLCLSYLFESPTPVVSLPCGHYMHGTCYKDLMAVTYKCPVCSRSAVNMELQWRKLDDEIALQPMPEDDGELETLLPHLEGAAAEDTNPDAPARRPRKAWISCNDCNARCWTPFHWLGLKCHACGGYNTNQIPPSTGRETEAERLIRQQQLQPRQHDFTGNGVLLDAGIGIASSDDGKVDSAYAMPSSPTTLSPSAAANVAGSPSYSNDRRASAGPASPRRYFVQEEEPRRASFTAPRFSTPSMPNLPRLPDLPRIPDLPSLPQMPRFPDMPNLPTMPNMPNLEIPRFSPYEMVQALSRSLSPMRYYMEGLDVRDGGEGSSTGQRAGRPPVRRSFSEGPESPPVPGASTGSKKAKLDSEGGGFWGSAVLSSGEEDDDDEEEEVEEESESEFETESEDEEPEEMTAVETIEEDDDVDELELFGHH